MTDKKKTDVPTLEVNPEIEKSMKKPLVIKIDGGLGRVIAMSWAITEVAKKRPVKVITSRPLVFWWNPYIQSVHGFDDRDLYRIAIKGNDYFELEPYTDPRFFNDSVNRLEIARDKLGLEKIAEPKMFLAHHEMRNNNLQGKPVLFQPFWSTMEFTGWDRSYRSFRVEDAQYIADRLIQAGYTVYEVFDKDKQPQLNGCVVCSSPNLRWIVSLASKYPVIWCDSCMHHAAKAFWKQSVVMWAATNVERYWYDSHINLWEKGMVEHTPMRLWINDFNFDIINQHSNEFSKEWLDHFVDESLKFLQSRYK